MSHAKQKDELVTKKPDCLNDNRELYGSKIEKIVLTVEKTEEKIQIKQKRSCWLYAISAGTISTLVGSIVIYYYELIKNIIYQCL